MTEVKHNAVSAKKTNQEYSYLLRKKNSFSSDELK